MTEQKTAHIKSRIAELEFEIWKADSDAAAPQSVKLEIDELLAPYN